MITVCRSEARQHQRRGKQEGWRTFHAGQATLGVGTTFGSLELLNEERLAPGGRIPSQPLDDGEVLTFVREGALTYEDSLGHSGVIHAGEFHRMTTERSLRHVQSNASPRDGAHAFQVWLRPSQAGSGPCYEQQRFSTAQRRGVLCLVGAPDGRRGSLRIRANALFFSVLLYAGQHVVHELSDGRTAWLHVVHGEVTLGDLVLATGDGAGITAERAVSLTARKDSELLLVDLGERVHSPSENGAPG